MDAANAKKITQIRARLIAQETELRIVADDRRTRYGLSAPADVIDKECAAIGKAAELVGRAQEQLAEVMADFIAGI